MENPERTRTDSDTPDVSDVLRRLETYEDLSAQCLRYGSLLENAITHRRSVRENIFNKVKEEYEEKKSSLEQSRKSLEDLLRGHLATFLRERDHLDSASQEEEDRLAEIDFRVLVGEYSEEGTAEERKALSQSLARHTQDLERMEAVLKAYTRAGFSAPSSPPADPPENDPQGSGSRELSASSLGVVQPVETEWTAREGTSIQPDASKAPLREPEAVGEFQVLGQGTDLCEDNCPVVQFLDGTPEEPLQEERGSRGKAGSVPPGGISSGCVSGYLVAMGGSRQGERFPLLCSNITLGSSPGCDIRLSDPGIKNFHAQIHFKGRKHYLENLDSMGCSFVNGSPGGPMELKDGDIIRLAEVKFQVEYSDVN